MGTSWKAQLSDGDYHLQFQTDDKEKYKFVEKAAQMVMDGKHNADIAELKHGFWSHGIDGTAYAKCSACGRRMNPFCYGYAYYPLCGAKMDGERREK